MTKTVLKSTDHKTDIDESSRSRATASGAKAKEKLAAGKNDVRILATTFHETKQESCYVFKFVTVSGERKRLLVGRENSSSKMLGVLLRAHAALPDDRKEAQKAIEKAISERNKKHYRVTSRTGWYGDSFVYVTRTFGSLSGKLQHEGHCDIDAALGLSRGDLQTWRDGMREPCKYSDFLLFALSVPASGPLLDPAGQTEGAVFHLQPENAAEPGSSGLKVKSSSGKTLAARAGLSEIGRCRKNDLVTFAATDRAVEDYCYAHNHLLGVFDEEGRGLSTANNNVKPAMLPYLVTSGVGKLRSRKATQDADLQNLRWALQVLSTGENPLDDPAKQTKRAEGAQARMIPIPVPPGGRGGIFNRVKGSNSKIRKKCRELAMSVESTIESNYGVALPRYIRKLVAERATLGSRIRQLVETFVQTVNADQDPWERRFAEKFGLVFAAAILLSQFGIAPWTKKRARIAITAIYKRARGASSSFDEAANALVGKLLKHIKKDNRFPVIKKGETLATDKASSAWGAIVQLPKVGQVLACRYSRVERLIKPSVLTQLVLRELSNRRLIAKSSDGKLSRQLMITGLTGKKRLRFVCFIYKRLAKNGLVA